MSTAAPAYDFSKCDECGSLLEPESRLFGLCPDYEREILQLELESIPKIRPIRDRRS